MASILPTEIPCVALTAGPGELCITMPGGAKLCAVRDVDFGDPAGIARGLMSQFNAALAPLQPIFNLLDVVIALKECMEAVVDSFGPPPDPTKLLECIPNLIEKVNAILKLLPPVSVPFAVKSLLSVLIVYLQGLKQELQAAIISAARIANAQTRAADLNNIRLQAIADCAEDAFDISIVNMNESVKPLSRLILTLNVVMELAGLPCIQIPLAGISAAVATSLLPIDAAIDLLTIVRDAIGIPELQLAAIPDPQDPC